MMSRLVFLPSVLPLKSHLRPVSPDSGVNREVVRACSNRQRTTAPSGLRHRDSPRGRGDRRMGNKGLHYRRFSLLSPLMTESISPADVIRRPRAIFAIVIMGTVLDRQLCAAL